MKAPMRPLSPSRLAKFRKCELLFLEEDDPQGEADETMAEAIGTAAHKLTLEGRAAYEAAYEVGGPINLKTGKPFGLDTQCVANWEAKHGKKVITKEMGQAVEAMATSVWKHADASRVLSGGSSEVHLEADYFGVKAHGWLDYYVPRLRVVDFKTCHDIDSFETDARRYGYAHQVSFYRELAAAKEGIAPYHIECFFVAVEKSEVFRCGVWRIGQDVLARAKEVNEAAITRLKECYRTNTWRTGYEEMREFDWL